ncbi:MAG: hopanoid biosynthesis associated glycosyl transferase HpnI [Sphingomonadales bacterium]|nr:hopanoid biosynthesis associated glycosyl transferase HpnI [Sphingomonadales bacterium]
MQFIGSVLLFLSAVGTLCLMIAAVRLWRIGHVRPVEARHDAVTILKPLYGAEPQLLANLSTFLQQDHAGEIQLICGVHSRTDPAVSVVEALQTLYPQADIVLTVESSARGTNAKVSNLIAMVAHARHPVLILSDSDMAVRANYLATVTAALAAPGVGAVTCLYHGRGDAGGWSKLAAMGISQHFLPSVLLGTALGLATPCMGSTIALRRTTLDAIGGLDAFADLLADDYAIGNAVRQRGKTVALPNLLLTHACTEASLAALVRQELRWNRTITQLDPMGFIGSIVLHPLPLSLLGATLSRLWLIATAILMAALLARTAIALLVDRTTGNRTAPLLWIAPRDLLSFVLFFWTFFGRAVDWRGTAFTVDPTGRLSTHQDNVQ